MTEAPEKLMNIREAAEALAVHPETLRRMTRAGRIPFIRVGSRLKFVPSDLSEFIRRRRIE
jgi:excisionase family DNA binding protein